MSSEQFNTSGLSEETGQHPLFDYTQEDPITSEVAVSVPETLEIFRGLSSPEGIIGLQKAWDSELEDSEMVHISRLEDRVSAIKAEALVTNDWRVQQAAEDKIKRIYNDEVRLFGSKKVERYKQIEFMKWYLETTGQPMVLGNEAEELAEAFLKSGNSQPVKKGVFIREMTKMVLDQPNIAIVQPLVGPTLDIPLDSIVSATSLVGWEEGRGKDIYGNDIHKEKSSSKDTIAQYAALETTIPPINKLYAFILPNGKMVYETENDHRVAAAKMRGQETIQFRGTLTIYELGYMPKNLDT